MYRYDLKLLFILFIVLPLSFSLLEGWGCGDTAVQLLI